MPQSILFNNIWYSGGVGSSVTRYCSSPAARCWAATIDELPSIQQLQPPEEALQERPQDDQS